MAYMPEANEARVRARPAAAVQWAVVGVLAFVAGALSQQLLLAPPAASAQSPAAASGGVLAVAGQISRDSYGVYLVDLRSGTITMYEYVSGERTLWLRAARSIQADRQLDDYNTKPDPKEILRLVSEASRMKPPTTQP